MQLRNYQIENSSQGLKILQQFKIVYFVMEVRTGKTLTALNTAHLYGAKNVLFITKIKAFSSIQSDYEALNPGFEITIINKESLHKVANKDYDLIIVDENHAVSSTFPKPNNAAKQIKHLYGDLPQIYLSGTPAIESASQWFHSFWISNNSPFKDFKNFYAWAKVYVDVQIKHYGQIKVNDYSKAKTELIEEIIEPYLVKFTQKEAGFKTEIKEKIIHYPVSGCIKNVVKKLLKDKVVEGKEEDIIGDNAAKLMSKIHQLENGTIIFESGNTKVIDTSKAEFIKEYFKGKKLGIFYFFKMEWELLKSVFGDNLTDNLDEFNSTEKHIALQQVSGSEGISLKKADALVIYNNGYSGRLAVQMVDRMTTIDREENNVYYFFDKDGINAKIYESIKNKKRYNEKTFAKNYAGAIGADFNPKFSKERELVRS